MSKPIQVVSIENGEPWISEVSNIVQLGKAADDKWNKKMFRKSNDSSPKKIGESITTFKNWGRIQQVAVAPESNNIVEIIRSNEELKMSIEKAKKMRKGKSELFDVKNIVI